MKTVKCEKKSKKRLIMDLSLIFSLLLLSFCLFMIYKSCAKNGSYAVVTVDGKELFRYSLSEDRVCKIEAYDGFENVLEIKDGKAKMISANCKDKICVSHFEISKEGESIVCLPHKLVVLIVCD